MIFGKYVTFTDDQKIAEDMYAKVFGQELQVEMPDFDTCEFLSPKTAKKDGQAPAPFVLDEPLTEWAMLYEEETPVGFGCVSFDGMQYRLEPVVVLPEWRKQGYGDFIVRLLLDKIIQQGALTVKTLALQGTEGFFAAVGYKVMAEPVEANGKMWVPMELDMNDIVSHCGGH